MLNPIFNCIAVWLQRRRLRGSTWFHDNVCKRQRLRVRTKHGLEMKLDPCEYVDARILHNGYYEEEVLNAVLDHLPQDGVFWDVGANLGLHGLTVKKLRPDIRVFAFEPNPMMSGLIEESALKNKVDLDVSQVALDAKRGVGELYLHPGNLGRSSLHNWDSEPGLAAIQVNLERGDDVVKRDPGSAPAVLKIDVEGNELRVLEGMSELLKHAGLKAIIFEDSKGASPVKDLIAGHGFKMTSLSRLEDTSHNLENFVAAR